MDIENYIAELEKAGYKAYRTLGPKMANYSAYNNPWNIYMPWETDQDIEHIVQKLINNNVRSLVSRDRLLLIKNAAINSLCLEGEIWEAGVYQGGSAALLAEMIRSRLDTRTNLRLFDTYEGMPETDPLRDIHKKGDFDDTSLESVSNLVGNDSFISYHKGLVPKTFDGLDGCKIKFAHIDLDIYQAIKDSCEFIWPKMVAGGIIIFDDYGFSTCPGARLAVDEFFDKLDIRPLILPTGSAIVIKSA